jgi:hypothetical protein
MDSLMSARRPRRARAAIVAAACLAAVGLAARLAPAQSLADVAKKEEERRKSVATPSKVYTNKDLNAVPGGAPPPPAPAKPADEATKAAEGDAKADATKPGDAAKGQVKDQKYWFGRLKELESNLLRDSNYMDAMQTRINVLNTDFVNRDDPAQRSVIERDRQKAIAELSRLKQAVADDKKAITAFEEEARRAGVPPGWLR